MARKLSRRIGGVIISLQLDRIYLLSLMREDNLDRKLGESQHDCSTNSTPIGMVLELGLGGAKIYFSYIFKMSVLLSQHDCSTNSTPIGMVLELGLGGAKIYFSYIFKMPVLLQTPLLLSHLHVSRSTFIEAENAL